MSDQTFTKAELDAAIEAAKAAQDDKNRELLAEVKDLKNKVRASQEIKPEDLTAAETRAEKAEAALAERDKAIKTLTTERDKAVKALEGETAFTQKLLIQDGLKSALLANGVKDEDFIDALSTKFAGSAAIITEGDVRKAVIGDKAVGDFVKEWAGSDAGKKFVAAPINGGGGAPGGSGGGGSRKAISQTDFNAMDGKARAAFFADGGVIEQAA